MLSKIKNRGLGKSIIAVMFCMMLTVVLSAVNSVNVYADCNPCEHCGGSGYVCFMHDDYMRNGGDSGETCYSACNERETGRQDKSRDYNCQGRCRQHRRTGGFD